VERLLGCGRLLPNGVLLMSRGFGLVVAGSSVVVGVASVGWGWFLSTRSLADAGAWSSILQGFGALLSVSALVVAVLALWSPGSGQEPGVAGSRSQSVSIGRVKDKKAKIDVRQDQRP
jgi:hypothetical protein